MVDARGMLRVNDTLQLDGGADGGGVHERIFCCGDALGHDGGASSAKVNKYVFLFHRGSSSFIRLIHVPSIFRCKFFNHMASPKVQNEPPNLLRTISS